MQVRGMDRRFKLKTGHARDRLGRTVEVREERVWDCEPLTVPILALIMIMIMIMISILFSIMILSLVLVLNLNLVMVLRCRANDYAERERHHLSGNVTLSIFIHGKPE